MDIDMKRRMAVLMACLLAAPCLAKTVTVDDDGEACFQTIQEAINGSSDGDTIVVRTGTYDGDVLFNGRRVTLRSEDPDNVAVVQATVIVGGERPAVVFDFNEDGDSVLDGFTITGQGILCTGTTPTISRNVIRNCNGQGIRGTNGAAPTIVGNTIVSSRQEGIYMCGGLIEGNTIAQNLGGIAFCDGPIRDNIISDNAGGGGLSFCNGDIVGNVITGNYSGTHGGGIYNCAGTIRNNIIAGNRAERDGGGLYNCTKAILNNTIVGNVAGDLGGGLSQCPSTVRNNIIAFNAATLAGGIYGPCSNTYNAYWSNAGGNFGGGPTWGLGDISVDPRFAVNGYWDDNGTADADDDFWVNGDYHLRSRIGRWSVAARQWIADDFTSQCIDAGSPSSDWSAELWPHGQRINLGVYGGTPQASLSPAELGHRADLNHDGRVGPPDLQQFSLGWAVEADLLAEDFDRNGAVDFNDFAILAASWRTGPPPPTPPLPDPMTWATRPYATGPRSIAMVATKATSADGTGVEYYFEEFFHPEFNSGWTTFGPDEEPHWEDTNLVPQETYWYRVKVRNRGNLLETQWSQRFAATTPREDFLAPAPNPLTWESEPHRSAPGTIQMVATQADDESGVEYEFECTSHPVYSSGWQDSPAYKVAALPEGRYTFRTRARDKSPANNATFFSSEVTVDLLPPTPDPLQWEFVPEKIQIGTGSLNYHATMTAVEATDADGPVEYFFWCTNESGFSSRWQSERTYTVKLGGKHVYAAFRVRARDASGNQTGWSPELPAQ